MPEPANDVPAPQDVSSASKSEDAAISAKQKPVTAASDASWTEVLNAMRLAEEAVSSAVQGMADADRPPPDNNHK
jgi:hypothetical protein